jgi:hypothetical protein
VAVLEPPVVLSKRGEHSSGCVVRAGSVIQKRPGACCRVGVCGVGKKRPSADGRIEVPILLLLIENQPIAVLFVPLVRLRRAFCPSAVLPPG